MPRALATLALLAVAWPGGAGADELAFRARPGGLDVLEEIAPMKLPSSFALSDLERELYDCPLSEDDIVAHVTGGEIQVEVVDLDLSSRDGVLVADVLVDVQASADLRVDEAYACFGTLTCAVGVSATPAAVGLEIELGTGPEQRIEVYGAEVSLGLTAADFDLQIDDCAAGDALEWAIEAVEGWALEKVSAKIEEIGGDLIAERAARALAESLPLHLEKSGFAVDAALLELDVDAFTGVTAVGEASVTWESAPSQSAPKSEPPRGEPLPRTFAYGDFSLAASDGLVTRALYEAWRGGVFDTALGDLAPSIELSEDGLAQKLGLPPGTRIDVGLELGAPPEVSFGRDEEGVRVHLPGLEAHLAVASPGEADSRVEILADVTLAATFVIDGDIGALILRPTELAVDRLEVVSGSSSLAADPARLESFLCDVGTPLLAERLEAMPLAPALRPTEGLYVWIKKIEAEGGWLRAGLNLAAPDPDDARPPETILAGAPQVIPAGLASIPVSGEDDTTPEPLLRFHATLDGEPLTEEPSFLHAIQVSAEDGDHVLEVAAVDLSGNVDPTPTRHDLVVDGAPPVLEVTRAPDGVITGPIEAAWRASDERGAVTTAWQLRELGKGDAVGAVIREGEAGSEGTLSLEGVKRSRLYVLRILAVDGAGNVTSADYGVSFEQGGCAAAGGTQAAGALLVLAALALFASRRRFLCAALLASLAGASAASAQAIGTNLSGPTDADGASSFWNPAAMVRGEGTRLDLGSGVSLVRVSFASFDTAGEPTGTSDTSIPKPEPTVGAYTDALGERWRLGITVGVPQAAGATWSRDGGAAAITRYFAASARHYSVAATPSVAYRPAPWIAIGGGVRVVHSRLEADLDKDIGKQLNLTVGSQDPNAPFPYADPALAAPVDLQTSGWGVGLVAGVLLLPSDQVTIGASVHTPSTARSSGQVSVEYPDEMRDIVEDTAPGAELPELAGDVEANLRYPLMAFTAVAVEPTEDWELRADYRYTDKSSLSNLDIVVVEATSPDIKDNQVIKGYHDQHSVGLRGLRRLRDGEIVAGLRVRYENNSVPEHMATPNCLDFEKYELGAVAYFVLSERIGLTAQYSKYLLPTRRVDESMHRPLAEPTLETFNHPSPTGTYRGTSDQVAVALSALW